MRLQQYESTIVELRPTQSMLNLASIADDFDPNAVTFRILAVLTVPLKVLGTTAWLLATQSRSRSRPPSGHFVGVHIRVLGSWVHPNARGWRCPAPSEEFGPAEPNIFA
jgi:hypothetical protein